MKLVVISHTPHYRNGDTLVGWGPTIREIDYLARVFDSVVHIAPVYEEFPPESSLPYQSNNVTVRPVCPAGGEGLVKKIGIFWAWGSYISVILRELDKADVVHVRCPANIGLLAVILLAFVRKPEFRWVKYAGNWKPEGIDTWSYAFQRWWLKKNKHQGVVTVNGKWRDQESHVHSFLNPSFTENELLEIPESAKLKELTVPVYLLFVGRLETAKGAKRVLEIAKRLKDSGMTLELHMVGDGPERLILDEWSRRNGLTSSVFFHGWVPRPSLGKFYSEAHFLLLPSSASEGWPKVLSEAMAYGVVPLAGAVSSIPQILYETGAGISFRPNDIDAFVSTIGDFVNAPYRWKAFSLAGIDSAHKFTYESYLDAVRDMFRTTWRLRLLTQDIYEH